MKNNLFKKTALIYIIGLCLFGFAAWYNSKTSAIATSYIQQSAPIVTTQTSTANPVVAIESEPVYLVLPRLGIELAVVRAEYDTLTNTWPVSTTAANYAINTPPISNLSGKTLIYAHAQKNLFATTSELKASDDLYITTADGHILHYNYASELIVPPSNVNIFDQLQGTPGVILMTCDGLWSENRRLMEFNYEGYL